jgi:hypothetical protein
MSASPTAATVAGEMKPTTIRSTVRIRVRRTCSAITDQKGPNTRFQTFQNRWVASENRTMNTVVLLTSPD